MGTSPKLSTFTVHFGLMPNQIENGINSQPYGLLYISKGHKSTKNRMARKFYNISNTKVVDLCLFDWEWTDNIKVVSPYGGNVCGGTKQETTY